MYRPFPKVVCLVVLFLLSCVPIRLSFAAHFEIPDGLVWFNSDRPINLRDLKGKFVIIYFWNYSGKSHQIVFDQYKKLQDKFPAELVVIGIHTGKGLDHDVINSRVAQTIRDYQLVYPMAVDPNMFAIKAFRLDRWPAAVLFAPDGSRLYVHTGERDIFSMFSRLIDKKKQKYKDVLNSEPIVFQLAESAKVEDKPLEKLVEADDLAKKSLGDRLLGSTVLDDPGIVVQAEIEPIDINSNGPSEEKTAAAKKIAEFDEKNFVGEIVTLDREYSRKIAKIILDIRLPDGAQLLDLRQSHVRVFSGDRSWFSQSVIAGVLTEVPIEREVASDLFYADVMLYYCLKGPKFVCIMKPILFKVPLGSFPKYEDIRIDYQLPLEKL